MHVVEHVEGRFAGRALRPGMEREIALNVLSQLGASVGGNPVGAGVHDPRAGAPTVGVAALGTPGRAGGGAGMAAVAGPMNAMAGSDRGLTGRGLLDMGLGGGDVLTGSAVAVNRETHGGILSFWSRGARSSFSGREGALSLGGDVRTTMVGADYAKGPLVAGRTLSSSGSSWDGVRVDPGLKLMDPLPEERRWRAFPRFPLIDDGLTGGADQARESSLADVEVSAQRFELNVIVLGNGGPGQWHWRGGRAALSAVVVPTKVQRVLQCRPRAQAAEGCPRIIGNN